MVPIMLRIKRQLPDMTCKILHDLMAGQPVQPLHPTLRPSPVTCVSQMSMLSWPRTFPPMSGHLSDPLSRLNASISSFQVPSLWTPPPPPTLCPHGPSHYIPLTTLTTAAPLSLLLLRDRACAFCSISPAPSTTLPPRVSKEYIFVGGRGERGVVAKGGRGERDRKRK